MLSTISFLSFPCSVGHLVAATRLYPNGDHNTPPRLTVALFLKKIPCRLMANLMRDCVPNKIERMFGKQTGGQIDFSVSVKAAACGSLETCIK